MDIIDKIFTKLGKEKASSLLRARILDIPDNKFYKLRKFPWFKIAVPVLLIAALLSGAYYRYFAIPKLAAAFELTVSDSDAAGIGPDSVFILKSSKDISAIQVKKVVKILPEVDFEVKNTGNNRFEIIPVKQLSGDTIYQISIAEGVGERDFSWAFQVRSPFAGLTTFPRNQGTGVPVNSSIEITFNRENIVDIDKYFEISPSVQGRFEVHNDTAIFLPSKSLSETTVYKVTVKKGLRAKEVEEALAEDIHFSFETSQTTYSNNPQLSFAQGFSYFPPDRKPALSVYSYNVDLAQSEAKIYAFSSKDEFIKSYYSSRDWDNGWAYYYRQNGSLFNTSKLAQVTSFKPQVITLDYQTFFELPESLPVGYYLVDLSINGIHRQAWVLINDVSHYLSLTDTNGLAVAYQYSKKSPINNAEIAYYDAQGNRHELGKTDANGAAQFTVPNSLKNSDTTSADFGKPKLLEITPQGQTPSLAVVTAGWWYNSGLSSSDNFWKYLSTDRFTYQLSDTIKFWGVIKGKTQSYSNQKVTVQLQQGGFYYDSYGSGFQNTNKPIAETQALISSFDTISGELSFKGLKPGTYQVEVLVNDKIISQSSVEILAYVKPAYHITVTPNKKTTFAGEPVEFNVQASFYEGTPLGAMSLKYSGYDGDKNVNGTVILNQQGSGKVTIVPEYSRNGYYPSSLYLTFTPVTAEEGDIQSDNSSESLVLVFGPHVYLQTSQKYKENNNFTITSKANHIVLDQDVDTRAGNIDYPEYIGKPASGVNLTAEIEKTEYVQIEDGTYYDPISKTNNPKYRYEERKTKLGTYSGLTSPSGEWNLDLNLPKSDRVFYTVTISGSDSFGRILKSIVSPYYYRDYGSIYYSNSQRIGKKVVLSLNFSDATDQYNKQVSVGEAITLKAEALEGKEFLNGQTLFYRYNRDGIGKFQFVQGNQWEDTFKKEYKPGITYRAVVFGPYGFAESNSLLMSYKKDDARLDIDIKPDKQTYRPGEEAKIDITVADKDGNTHGGEVNLSVVDEALFDIMPYYWQQDILQSLYQIDYQEPLTQVSDFSPADTQQNGGAEGGGCFLAGTPILLPSGKTKNIEDVDVGDLVLTRAEENSSRVLTTAIVQGISSHLVNDYLIINKSLQVTQEHRLYVNGKWLEAGRIKIGDTLEASNGKKVSVVSVQKVLAPQTMVYNFNVGKFHTYFAGGYFAHNAEKGGGYRSDFLDTAHFESKKLQNGKASFRIKLPDNITSWRATASAFETEQVYAGQESTQLPATLPLFVDTVISQTYLAGDKPIVTARVFGTSIKPNSLTQFEMVINGLNYKNTQTSTHGMSDFILPELKVGKYEMKLKAKQGNFEDGIIKTFEVVDSYFLTKQSNIIELFNGLKGLPASQNGSTNVTFTDAGKGQFYQELIWNQNQEGKRSDQVVASYIAQKLLKQYFGSTETIASVDMSAYYVLQEGIGLFTYGDSDLEATAQISDLVPESVYQSQLTAYFRSVIKHKKTDIHQIAKSLYGLAALHQPVLAKLQFIKDEPDLNLQDRLYISLGLARLGDKETARQYYLSAIRNEIRFEGGEAWLDKEKSQSKQVKLTSLSGAVAAAIGQHEDALAIWNYLQSRYPSEQLDKLERMMIIKDEIGHLAQNDTSLSYEINGKKNKVSLEKGQSKSVYFTKDELSQLTFSDVQGKVAALVVVENFQNPDNLEKNKELSIKRSFWVNGKQVNQINEGDSVTVKLEYSISKNAIEGGYQVVDYLPSGLKPVTNIWQRGLSSSYERCSQKGEPMAVDGNKVYFSAYQPNACGTYTLEYYARAAAKGSFSVNPPLIQSLKNYNSLNVGQSQTLNILSANGK